MTLSLVGYTTGGGEAPQFMEPVFSDGEAQYAQVCNDDQIIGFVKVDEELDLLEHNIGALYEVGSPQVYAVLDSGDRVISGDRNYVTRYLSQNKDSYVDKPFFYTSVLEFCGLIAPELQFIEHRSELLEIAAMSNSIRRFFVLERHALLNCEKSLPSESTLYWLQNSNNSSWEDWSKASSLSGKDRSYLELYLDFAKMDAPRLAQQSRWRDIGNIVERASSRDSYQSKRYLYYFCKAAEEYLADQFATNDGRSARPTTASRSLTVSPPPSSVSSQLKKYRRWLVSAFKSKISDNIASHRTSSVEISMAALFFKISIKIYKDEILENEEARLKIADLTRDEMEVVTKTEVE